MKYSLAGLMLLISLFGVAVGGFTSANLHLVFAISNLIFASNLVLTALAVRTWQSQSFWLGFGIVCWGVQLMEQTRTFANVFAVFLCNQHGYFVSIPATGGMKNNEVYFTPYYPSGSSSVYSSLIVQTVALMLGLVGGTIASYKQKAINKTMDQSPQ